MKSFSFKTPRKKRQCPHCKSKKGFELRYTVGGNGMVQMNFKGQTLDAEREVFDTMDRTACCLNCGKQIETDYIQTD